MWRRKRDLHRIGKGRGRTGKPTAPIRKLLFSGSQWEKKPQRQERLDQRLSSKKTRLTRPENDTRKNREKSISFQQELKNG